MQRQNENTGLRIIAEIGVNHNGSLEKALKLVEEAAKCGCNGVKFQIFKAERLSEKDTPKVDYQEKSGNKEETHYEMLKKLEFSAENHAKTKILADKLGLIFITTPYDPESAEEVYKEGVRRFKVASADLGDVYLHKKINSIKPKEVMLGTGMSDVKKIQKIVNIYSEVKPTLLHCVSAYPCEDSEINALAADTMKNMFEGHEIGYSDHGQGIIPALVFASRGIKLFERHFTLNKKDNGPDHYASSDPDEMRQYVNAIKRAQKILGNETKGIQEGESGMNRISKKGIKTKYIIEKDEEITLENTYAIRPAIKGISIDYMHKVIGTKARRCIPANTFIQLDDLKKSK